MQDLAAPDGLAGEAAISPAPPSEPTEDDLLSAAYDKLTQEEPTVEDAPPEPVDEAPNSDADETETAEQVAKEPAEPPPSFLPGPVKEKWNDLDPAVREAIAQSQGEMSRKLADASRQMQGIGPIRDNLVEMSKEFPQLLNMKPQDVLSEMREMAVIGQQLQQDPIRTVLAVSEKYGITSQLAEFFNGKQVQPNNAAQQHVSQLQAEIRGLKAQLEQVGNPQYLQEQMSSFMAQTKTLDEVTNFAQSAEHWEKVEPHLPQIIPFVRDTMPGASNADILKASYEMAIQRLVPQATKPGGDEPPVTADPKKAEAALKAKSVNVQGSMSGKPRQMSEDEMLSAAFDRAQRR